MGSRMGAAGRSQQRRTADSVAELLVSSPRDLRSLVFVLVVCHEHRRESDSGVGLADGGAVREMEVGPPGSPCRGRLQTTAGCVG